MTKTQIEYYRKLLNCEDYMERAAKEMAAEYVDNLTKPCYRGKKERENLYNRKKKA